MTWSELPLGELIELKRGYDLPAPARRPGGVPVVSSRGITGSHDRARVPGPGVVTGRTGTIGGVFFLERDFWPLNTTLYVRDFRGNDPRFVAYLLRTIDFEAHNDKAAIPGVDRRALGEVVVRRPPAREQRSIAARLARFDRLRSHLARMRTHLALQARTLFRTLPAGHKRRVEELCEAIGNGGTPSRREPSFWQGGTIPWFKSGELDDGPLVEAEERISERGLRASACRLWPEGSVLLAMYAWPTVGRLGILQAPAAANQACCALVARADWGGAFLFHALLETRDALTRLAGGAAQQNINQRLVREHEIEVPDAGSARAFSGRAARMHALSALHAREARLLERMQTLLLHRLLGQV